LRLNFAVPSPAASDHLLADFGSRPNTPIASKLARPSGSSADDRFRPALLSQRQKAATGSGGLPSDIACFVMRASSSQCSAARERNPRSLVPPRCAASSRNRAALSCAKVIPPSALMASAPAYHQSPCRKKSHRRPARCGPSDSKKINGALRRARLLARLKFQNTLRDA
jgi:hypothetical protein